MACKKTGRRIAFCHSKVSGIGITLVEKRGILIKVLKMEKCFIFGEKNWPSLSIGRCAEKDVTHCAGVAELLLSWQFFVFAGFSFSASSSSFFSSDFFGTALAKNELQKKAFQNHFNSVKISELLEKCEYLRDRFLGHVPARTNRCLLPPRTLLFLYQTATRQRRGQELPPFDR